MTGQTRTAVVIGSGSGGRAAALDLAGRGLRVTVVEEGRVGGECPYTACVPSKVLLLAARAGLDAATALAVREEAVDGRDDEASVEGLAEAEVTLVRGRGRLAGPGRVAVDGRPDLAADVVVLAPGSRPARPPVDGLDDVPTWTSDEALSASELPRRLAVLGGGAVGCELAQAFCGLGIEVHLVEVAPGLLSSEEPFVGRAVADRLEHDGVRVLVGATAERAERDGDDVVLHLDDGRQVRTDRVLVAGGRTPSSADLGLVSVHVFPDDHGFVPVDARCRVLADDGRAVPGLFAVGDVTATSSYTHSANAQARVVGDEVDGRGRDFEHRSAPRVVFTEPAVWCTGLTRQSAADAGTTVRWAETDLADVERGGLTRLVDEAAGVRPATAGGRLGLLVERGTDVVLGAAAVGPGVDGWAGELALAVHHRLTVDDLAVVQRGFLTWSETVTALVDQLQQE